VKGDSQVDAALARRAAPLWRRILRKNPAQVFGSEFHPLLQRNSGDLLAQPGYVGERYSPGGLIFVSMNPGGGPSEGLGRRDIAQYKCLRALRNSSEDDAASRFRELTGRLAEWMPGWKIIRNFVEPVLGYAHLEFDQVAYVNLLKWRTRKSSGLTRLYSLSWQDHTADQISLLRPSVVVAIGANAGKAFGRHYQGDARLEVVPRIFSNIGPPGRLTLRGIKRTFDKHPLMPPHTALEPSTLVQSSAPRLSAKR